MTVHYRDQVRLPPGAVVANAARGTLIDDDALIAALQSGQIAAAGLDIYNNKPDVAPGLRALANVVLLPHGIDAVLAGRKAGNLVG